MFVYLFLVIVGGFVGNLIGTSKNRIVWGMFMGILLGPLGWLIVALGPNNGPRCPFCKGVVIKGATKCKNCGSDLLYTDEK